MPNNPFGADFREILVVLQKLFEAAQPERLDVTCLARSDTP